MLTQVTTDMVKAAEALELNPGDVLTFDGTKWVAQPGVPSGTILQFAGISVPTGWLLCDGSAVSRASYAGLFIALGTTYGAGNGTTTFNVPDLRGRVPVGMDNMGGSSANRITASQADTLGGTGGSEAQTISGSTGSTTLTASQIPAHAHTQQTQTPYSNNTTPQSPVTHQRVGNSSNGTAGTFYQNDGVGRSWGTAVNAPVDVQTQNSGSSDSHSHSFSSSPLQVTQPWLALSYIIKA